MRTVDVMVIKSMVGGDSCIEQTQIGCVARAVALLSINASNHEVVFECGLAVTVGSSYCGIEVG